MILEIMYITIFLQLQLGCNIWNAQKVSQKIFTSKIHAGLKRQTTILGQFIVIDKREYRHILSAWQILFRYYYLHIISNIFIEIVWTFLNHCCLELLALLAQWVLTFKNNLVLASRRLYFWFSSLLSDTFWIWLAFLYLVHNL